MKISNYLAKLPQETTIKNIQVLKNYDLITLDMPAASQRLCHHCGSNDCVIKGFGTMQTVRHIPCNHRSTIISVHKCRLLCTDCHSSFYKTPYWIHPSLRMTQALYDSILLDLIQPLAFSEVARRNHVPQSTVQSVFQSIHFGWPAKLPVTICIDEAKGTCGVWSSESHRWYRNKYHCGISDGGFHSVIDVLDQISDVYLNKYFHQFSLEQRKRVRYFCCDMNNGFVSVSRKNFPNTKICIDPFHIVKCLGDMVDDVLNYTLSYQTGHLTCCQIHAKNKSRAEQQNLPFNPKHFKFISFKPKIFSSI